MMQATQQSHPGWTHSHTNKKGVHGLKQATTLAHNHLKNDLTEAGYSPIISTVGLWEHHTKPTKFFVFASMTLAQSVTQRMMQITS